MIVGMKKYIPFFIGCVFPLLSLELEDLSWEPQGPSAQEFNGYLQQAIADENWWSVIDYADILSYHFPTSPFAQDGAFLIGEAYFHLGQPSLANDYFTVYLNNPVPPRRFEEAIEYKFHIAERFLQGEKKPLFDSHKGPKIFSAKEDALKIYDEVIVTLPHSEFAARSLLGKAKIQAEFEDYKPSLETLDLLIRRFPKSEFAAAAYLDKLNVYLIQCQGRSLDPDLLDLSAVTLRKFRISFPREPRLEQAEECISKMQELFAQHLLETGLFFKKTKKTPAALIYFNKVAKKYPKTVAAEAARQQLVRMQPLVPPDENSERN